jgi:Rrf2 family protein
MLSDTAEYALRAVLFIAQRSAPPLVRADQVADALGVPRNYLSKILNTLAKRRVLLSTRGPQGGFRLARSPDSIPILRVIEPFDSIRTGRTCILGRPQCNDRNPCPAHELWKGISDQVTSFFRNTTVGDLLREMGSLT